MTCMHCSVLSLDVPSYLSCLALVITSFSWNQERSDGSKEGKCHLEMYVIDVNLECNAVNSVTEFEFQIVM